MQVLLYSPPAAWRLQVHRDQHGILPFVFPSLVPLLSTFAPQTFFLMASPFHHFFFAPLQSPFHGNQSGKLFESRTPRIYYIVCKMLCYYCGWPFRGNETTTSIVRSFVISFLSLKKARGTFIRVPIAHFTSISRVSVVGDVPMYTLFIF